MMYYIIMFFVGVIITFGIGIWVGIDVTKSTGSLMMGILSGIGTIALEWALLGFGMWADGHCGNIDDKK